MFVAEPAEETTEGAEAMRADGVFERFGTPALGFALHVGPAAAGTLSLLAGPIAATNDTPDIAFVGGGGHGSAPSLTIDPVLMASRFVVDVLSVISREKGPFDVGVLTVGSLKAGTAANAILGAQGLQAPSAPSTSALEPGSSRAFLAPPMR